MAINGKLKPKKPTNPASKWRFLSHPLLVGIIVAILVPVASIIAAYLQRPDPISGEVSTEVPSASHKYSFVIDGKMISGESISPFEKGSGYYARIESCIKFGIENILVSVVCYMTIKLSENLTISNSENFTEAIYSDGKPAKICCMYIDNSYHSPLYIIKLPSGIVNRYTYARGSEIHVMLNIPDADMDHDLDAIKFAPGEGVAPILFPIKDKITDRVFSTSFVNAHRNDPGIQEIVADSIKLRSELKANEEANKGLTYRLPN